MLRIFATATFRGDISPVSTDCLTAVQEHCVCCPTSTRKTEWNEQNKENLQHLCSPDFSSARSGATVCREFRVMYCTLPPGPA